MAESIAVCQSWIGGLEDCKLRSCHIPALANEHNIFALLQRRTDRALV